MTQADTNEVPPNHVDTYCSAGSLLGIITKEQKGRITKEQKGRRSRRIAAASFRFSVR